MVTTDLYGRPFQLTFVRPGQMMLFANVICDPCVGQTTIIPYNQHLVTFTVLVESSRSFPKQVWEVSLWHNGGDNRSWIEQSMPALSLETERELLAVNSKARSKVYRHYFSVDLPRPKVQDPVQFTLKFRTSSSEAWNWINKQSGLKDGELYFQPQSTPQRLSDYLEDYSRDLNVHSVPSEAYDTKLWTITSSVQAAKGKASGYTNVSLGIPRTYTRWLSVVRIWTPWLAPRHGQGIFSPPEDVVICSFLRWDGLHLALLAMSGVEDVVSVLRPGGQGSVILSSRNDSEDEGQAMVIAAVGNTFESVIAAAMYHARKVIHGEKLASSKPQILTQDGVKADWMENWSDGLTYCTWNSLGQNLNEQKIYDALDDLRNSTITSKGLRVVLSTALTLGIVTNLIIDDNWQTLDNDGLKQTERAWLDFEANKEGFPQGLKHTVSQIRQRHPNIRHIAVWHALLGYWGGISPAGSIAKKYKTRVVRKNDGGLLTVIDADDVQRFYHDFYLFLVHAGIDSVKTDGQFFLDVLANADERRILTKAYQDAWYINSLRFFSNNVISCMSLVPQIIFHSQLPTNRPRIMLRNSDDFFPDIPNSHPWHIFSNAHNALLTSHLNVLPDWDMFQTAHPYSSFHAAARCLSGGPVYITDEPGKHDLDLIEQITARTVGGRTVTLRPSVRGKAIGTYNAYEEERLLRVGTFSGGKRTGTGILGVFNVSARILSEFINLSEFPGMEVGEEYIIRAHTTGDVSNVMRLDDKSPVVSLELPIKGWEILSSFPLHSFKLKGSQHADEIKVAVLGLLGKMTGAAAVLTTEMQVDGNGRLRIESSIKALGVLGVYISDLSTRVIEDTIMITILGRGVPQHTVSAEGILHPTIILRIDIERAWNELGFDGRYSNEVPIVIYIS